jgi:hypothetical protein
MDISILKYFLLMDHDKCMSAWLILLFLKPEDEVSSNNKDG